MAELNLDLSGNQAQSFDLLPEGEYKVCAVQSEIKETKAGTGRYIKVTFQVMDGDHEGRQVWANFNIRNQNPEAERIGLDQLKTFLTACGHPNPDSLRNTDEFHGRAVLVKIVIKKSPEYGDSNEVKRYKSVKDVSPSGPATGNSQKNPFAGPIPQFS